MKGKGQRIGYIRVSSFDQNPERQLDQVLLDKVFTDKASGKATKRPELEALLSFVREGDTVVVHSMDCLARNLDDLRSLLQQLTERGIRIEFIKEHLMFTGEDSPMANLMLSVMGSFAEFERALIRERQREGIELAFFVIIGTFLLLKYPYRRTTRLAGVDYHWKSQSTAMHLSMPTAASAPFHSTKRFRCPAGLP